MVKFPPRRIERRPVEVEGPDGALYKGEYWTETGSLYVESADRRTSPPAQIGHTDERCLAKILLLEVYGHPRVTWVAGWKPAGCKDLI